jgi:hypothetical protein
MLNRLLHYGLYAILASGALSLWLAFPRACHFVYLMLNAYAGAGK